MLIADTKVWRELQNFICLLLLDESTLKVWIYRTIGWPTKYSNLLPPLSSQVATLSTYFTFKAETLVSPWRHDDGELHNVRCETPLVRLTYRLDAEGVRFVRTTNDDINNCWKKVWRKQWLSAVESRLNLALRASPPFACLTVGELNLTPALSATGTLIDWSAEVWSTVPIVESMLCWQSDCKMAITQQ